MAKIIKTVGTWEEFKEALQKGSGSSDDYLTISITKDIECTEQHPLPAKNYWIEIDRTVLNILGNNHTISNINVPADYKYSYLFYYVSYGYHTVSVYDLKIINISIPYSIAIGSGNDSSMCFDLYRCTITGVFDFLVTSGSYAVYLNKLNSCNIVQLSPRTQDKWQNFSSYFISDNLYYTHYYYTHLNNIKANNRHPARVIYNSYIELNPGMTNLAEHTIIVGDGDTSVKLNQSCINCNKKLYFPSLTENNTATGVTLLNCTNDQSVIPDALKNNIKIITDEQMKNADYLNSIGFTVTPTN